MSEIQRILSDISAFMAGNNHSYTPRLKKLYESYLEPCEELARQLQECRSLIEKGMLADARNLNLRNNPTLVEKFNILNIPERREFVELCENYNLQPMPPWDEEVIHNLTAPITSNDVKMASIMQKWRKIARNGTPAEKIQILRQIVAITPQANASWRKNLAEAEKYRYAEIEEQLKSLKDELDELPLLNQISQELYSPQLLTHPKETLLEKLKAHLVPLQKKELARQMEQLLDEINANYEAQKLTQLETSLNQWAQLCTHPLCEIRPEQKQTIADATAFLNEKHRLQQREIEFQELFQKLKYELEKGIPFAELEKTYNILALTEHEIPEEIIQRMQTLKEEALLLERQHHIRHCLYGICLAIILLLALGSAIILIQYYNQVKSSCAQMKLFIANEQFEETDAFIKALTQESPRVAKASKIMALYSESQQKYQEKQNKIQTAQKEFAQLQATLNTLTQQHLLESDELTHILERGNELKPYLNEEQNVALIQMQEQISLAKEQIRLNREQAFLTKCRQLSREITQLLHSVNHTIKLEILQQQLADQKQAFTITLRESKVSPAITGEQQDILEKQFKGLEYAITEETKYRHAKKQLLESSSATEYLSQLLKLHQMPVDLKTEFSEAEKRASQWQNEMEDSILLSTLITSQEQMANQLKRYGERSLFMAEFNHFYQQPQTDSIEEFFKNAKDEFTCYELAFKTQEGNTTFFYTTKQPELEWDKRYPQILRNIIAWIDDGNGKDEKLAIFKTGNNVHGFINQMADYRTEWKLPESFAELSGFSKEAPAFTHCLPARFYLNYQKNIASKADRFQQEILVWDTLKQAISTPMNPILKNKMILLLLKWLSSNDSYYQARFFHLIEQLTPLFPDNAPHWKRPDTTITFHQQQLKQQELLTSFDWDNIKNDKELINAFLKDLHAHQIAPIGFLVFNEKTFQFVTFDKQYPREMLVINNGILHKLFTEAKDTQLAPQDKQWCFNGQLLWGCPNGQTCEEFLKEWKNKRDTTGVSLEIQTKLCPLELNYLLK